MNITKRLGLIIFMLVFSFIIGYSPSVNAAQHSLQFTDDQLPETSQALSSPDLPMQLEPTPDPPSLQEMEPFSLSATSAVTVTLGAWRNLRPTESYLRDVSMLRSTYDVDCQSPDQKSKGWIVGDSGVILSYCNGVWDHAIVVESVPTNLWGVQAITPELGVAVGDQGAVLMYLYDTIADDWVWTKSPIPVGNQTLFDVSMVSDGDDSYTGWGVGWKNANGRGTLIEGTIDLKPGSAPPTYEYEWTNLTDHYPDLPTVDLYFAVQMLSPSNGWAVGGTYDGSGVIIHWNGSEWSLDYQVENGPLYGLHMLPSKDGWVVGNGGAIYHYDGSTWSQVPSPTKTELLDIDFSEDEKEGWAVGYGGTLIKFDKGSWSTFADLRTDYFDFYSLDLTSGHGWIAGFHLDAAIGGQILEYKDDLWLAVTPPTDNRLNDIAVVSDNNAWAVGIADAHGGTIIHWDGKHWQRWYQKDLAIPAVNLYAIDMISPTEGWAAGDPPVPGEPALFLRWNGHRWYQPRYDSPLNVRVNDIALLDRSLGIEYGGWAVASNGNAVAKWDGASEYWSANHTCQGVYYNLRSTSIISATNTFGWDAWAVGSSLNPAIGEHFMRYLSGCATGYAWQPIQSPSACLNDNGTKPDPDDGPWKTTLRGSIMQPGPWGFSVGNYNDRASIYSHDGSSWTTGWCERQDSDYRPTRFYTTDIVEDTGTAWYAGFYTSPASKTKHAYIFYNDADGLFWVGSPFPINGTNIYHRPVFSLDMSSDTMGWAVGEDEESGSKSVIYQYPYPNFTLDTQPESRAVIPGDSTFFTATVNSIGGFDADVSLSIPETPKGIEANVTPDSINAQKTATIQVSTEVTTPVGVYYIPLRGSATFRSGDNDIPVSRTTYLRVTVTYNPIYAVTPDSGPAGTVVSITGANFGADPGKGNRSTTANHVILAGVQLPDSSVTSWSDTQIKVSVPDDPVLFPQGPQFGEVSVTANSSTSNADLTFQLENFLEDINLAISESEITIRLTGTSLGEDPGALFRSTYFEHVSLYGEWIPAVDILSWENNTITLTVPLDASTGQITVTSNGYESNPLIFTNPGTSSTDVLLPLVVRD